MADSGILYFYQLEDNRTYIGRFKKNDLTSRARDHFYNAVVSAYNVGVPLYHKGSANFFGISNTKVQSIEEDWGFLMKKENPIFYDFMKLFIKEGTNIGNLRKDIKNKVKLIKTTYEAGAGTEKIKEYNQLIEKKKNKANKLKIKDLNTQIYRNIKVVDKEGLETIFKENIKNPSNINNKKVGIKSFKVKYFKISDSFWEFKYNNQKCNIIDIINNLTNKENLQDVSLGEYLLISLDMTNTQNFLSSLNRKIGDFQDVYNNYVEKHNAKEIREMYGDIDYDKLKTKIENEKITANKLIKEISRETAGKIIVEQSQQNEVYFKLKKWFSEKQSLPIDAYWADTPDTSKEMLYDSFKYTLKLLDYTKINIEKEIKLSQEEKDFYNKNKIK